jgi:hypothetical protein
LGKPLPEVPIRSQTADLLDKKGVKLLPIKRLGNRTGIALLEKTLEIENGEQISSDAPGAAEPVHVQASSARSRPGFYRAGSCKGRGFVDGFRRGPPHPKKMNPSAVHDMGFGQRPVKQGLVRPLPVPVFMPVAKGLQLVFEIGIKERKQQFFQLSIGKSNALLAQATKKMFIYMKRRLAAVDEEPAGIASQFSNFARIKNVAAAVGFPEHIHKLPGTSLLSG